MLTLTLLLLLMLTLPICRMNERKLYLQSTVLVDHLELSEEDLVVVS